jgi:hypothetical protein
MNEPFVFEPEVVFRALNAHGVRYVVIGGYAAVLHGSPTVTADADICAARDPENLDRLAAALRDTHARIRTHAVPEGVQVAIDGEFLAKMAMVTLVTDGGAFDLSFHPAAFPSGFDALAEHAVAYDLDGLVVPVASLDDIIASKRAADRPKDRAVLPILEALRDEIALQGGS